MKRNVAHAESETARSVSDRRRGGSAVAAIRPYAAVDAEQVLALVNADRLPGQPVATPKMLAEPLAGRSPVDAGWWQQLAELRTEVLTGPGETVAGVVSYARRPRDGAGLILWLHGREDARVVSDLIVHVMRQLDDCAAVEAFSFATALGLGLEALPVRHRAVTDQALRDAGFAGHDLWRYMHRPLPAPELPHASVVEVTTPQPRQRQLTVRDRGQVAAEATIGTPVAGIGVLWWISVEPAHQGAGLGAGLLGTALDMLAGLGAAEVILYVDDDDPDPHSERSRAAANRLYDRAGFTQVDRLHSYRLPR